MGVGLGMADCPLVLGDCGRLGAIRSTPHRLDPNSTTRGGPAAFQRGREFDESLRTLRIRRRLADLSESLDRDCKGPSYL